MDAPNGFETRFAKALAQTPAMPDCYDGLIRRIKRRSVATRLGWGIAALLAISLTSLLYFSRAHQAIPLDVAEEIQSIQSHVAGDDILEEIVSCSLVDMDIE
jgi:hypothetical protein